MGMPGLSLGLQGKFVLPGAHLANNSALAMGVLLFRYCSKPLKKGKLGFDPASDKSIGTRFASLSGVDNSGKHFRLQKKLRLRISVRGSEVPMGCGAGATSLVFFAAILPAVAVKIDVLHHGILEKTRNNSRAAGAGEDTEVFSGIVFLWRHDEPPESRGHDEY